MRVIRFTASWCGPCKMLAKSLEQEGIVTEVVDVDKDPTTTSQYSIRGVPSIVVLNDDGAIMERYSGAPLKPEVLKKLKEYTS